MRAQGRVKNYSELRPFLLAALLEQEAVAGPRELSTQERQLRVEQYYKKHLGASLSMQWHTTPVPPGPGPTEADVERGAEGRRLSIEQALTSGGVVVGLLAAADTTLGPARSQPARQVPGDTTWFPEILNTPWSAAIARVYAADYDRLEAIAAITDSAFPTDVKVCALRELILGDPIRAWLLAANFQPTTELKERLAKDKARVTEALKQVIPPGAVPWSIRP